MKVSHDKQMALLRVLAISGILSLFCWYWFVQPQQKNLSEKAARLKQVDEKIATTNQKLRFAGTFKSAIDAVHAKLGPIEEGMIRGDSYLWVIKTLSKFQLPGRFDISNYGPPQPADWKGPKLPYPPTSFGIVGNAYYFDVVDFLQRFEKTFPHIRIQKVELEPASFGTRPEDEEKLTFRIEMIALVRSAPAE